jgi:ribosome-binding protein aMBF1 (putative translation factor)
MGVTTMAMSGAAKLQYQREYMRRKRNAGKVVASCDFCGEDASGDRLMISDYDGEVMICEECIGTAVGKIAAARGRKED